MNSLPAKPEKVVNPIEVPQKLYDTFYSDIMPSKSNENQPEPLFEIKNNFTDQNDDEILNDEGMLKPVDPRFSPIANKIGQYESTQLNMTMEEMLYGDFGQVQGQNPANNLGCWKVWRKLRLGSCPHNNKCSDFVRHIWKLIWHSWEKTCASKMKYLIHKVKRILVRILATILGVISFFQISCLRYEMQRNEFYNIYTKYDNILQ